jgi:hypothetical protein
LERLCVIRVDMPANASVPLKGQDPGEVLPDVDAAGCPVPALKYPHYEDAPEVAGFVQLDMEAAERLPVTVDVSAQVVAVVERAEFITKVDGRIKQRIEPLAEYALVGVRDDLEGQLDVLVRYRSRSLSLTPAARRLRLTSSPPSYPGGTRSE